MATGAGTSRPTAATGRATPPKPGWTGRWASSFRAPSIPRFLTSTTRRQCFSPGVAYIVRPGWTIALTPFLLGKAVRDPEQSAWAFGGRVDFSQKFRSGVYLLEYFVYTDSRAKEDVYSYTENTLGLYLGMRWTPKIFTEVGYEFSRGDSFFSTNAPAPPVGGGGGPGSGGGGDTTPPPTRPRCTRIRRMATRSRSPQESTGRGPGFRPRTTPTEHGMAIRARRTKAPDMRASGSDSESLIDEEGNMNSARWNRLPVGVAAFLILLASASFAQQGAGGSRMYDPKTVETVKGEVVSVEKVPSPQEGMDTASI